MRKKTPNEFICEKWGLNPKNENSDFTIPINSAIGFIDSYNNYLKIIDRINTLEDRIMDANNHPRNSFFIGVKIASENEIKELKVILKSENKP